MESSNTVAKLEVHCNKELHNLHLNDHKEKHIQLSKNQKVYENKSEKRRLKKWQKIEEKPLKTIPIRGTDNSGKSYSTKVTTRTGFKLQ